jgi:hypothetical protein
MKGNEDLRCSVGSILAKHCPMRGQLQSCKYLGPSGTCDDCSFHWCLVAGFGLEVVTVFRGNYKTAQKRIKVLEERVRELEDTCPITLKVDRGTISKLLGAHREEVEKQMETIEVKCTKCGAIHRVPKGQLTQEGISQYVCETCSEAVLERRVEDLENRKGGRQLLTD